MAAQTHPALRKTHSCVNAKKEDILDARSFQHSFGSNTTDFSDVLATSSDLKSSQEDFENFISEVSNDLMRKIGQLKAIKHNQSVPWTERSYASVQIIMLNQYVHRIKRFKVLSNNSLETMTKAVKVETKMKTLAAKHIDMLGKFKRRLKHMLDVTEKHVAVNMLTINVLHQRIQEDDLLSQSLAEKEKEGKKHESSVAFQRSISESEESSEDAAFKRLKRPRLNSFRSISDHLTVLSKTYTNRR